MADCGPAGAGTSLVCLPGLCGLPGACIGLSLQPLSESLMGARKHRILKTWLLNRRSQSKVLAAHRVTVDQPMILISQVSRSGGTLLKELLDGHPQLWVMHRGLKFSRRRWPTPDLTKSLSQWWQQCHRGDKLAEDYRYGFTKKYNEDRPLPFLFNAPAQKRLFRNLLGQQPPAGRRDVWNAYLSSYFSAWMDYQQRYSEPKAGVVNFSSWVMLFDDNVAEFFADYPDGRLIQIVRQPVSWCASVNKQGRKAYDKTTFQSPETALPWWQFNTQGVLRNKKQYGERIVVLDFDGLVRNTQHSMQMLSKALGISYHPHMLTPTMNGMQILANSSFAIDQHGVQESTSRRDSEFDQETLALIEKETSELWREVSSHSINQMPVPHESQ
ncbi:MAG: hypothetical protein EA349_04980 [Halomonadaceae bacterium]|nr:MAG: hypothetical protein EA349_04980 [Halomonadaceae bacterium]